MEREKIDYAAWIGLDWGSYKHAICLQPADSGPIERCTWNKSQRPCMVGL
jgi:hypothetical protein